jgi:hypothetical protein
MLTDPGNQVLASHGFRKRSGKRAVGAGYRHASSVDKEVGRGARLLLESGPRR